MSFICCGLKYAKNDNDTYWCIETDLIKEYTKKIVNGEKVQKEIVETCICKKCGCIKVHIKRFGRIKGHIKILEVEKLSGDEADLFLIKTQKIRIPQPQKCPMKSVPFTKNVPLVFGKAISETKQRKRYEGDRYWSDKFDKTKNCWVEDIIESEIKLIKI